MSTYNNNKLKQFKQYSPGWVDGWMDVKAGLRTACPQSKNKKLCSVYYA